MTYFEWWEKYVEKPEKMCYNMLKENVLEQLKEYSTKMNIGNQSKHIEGSHNYDPTRGTLIVDPQELYELYSGKGYFIQSNSGDWNRKERFAHYDTIGIYRSTSGKELSTKNGVIHYSKKKGWHIVPARPD